ncbi:hypothetical protein [Abyssibius alkaniclasticus]|uniref:hypothetical protein n=1 Tax=Abyssibius alkaniclasticus TaxID=2881234 RepID=UPI00405868AE
MNKDRPDNLQQAAEALQAALQAGKAPMPLPPLAQKQAKLQKARARLAAQSPAAVQKLRDGFAPLAEGFAEAKYALDSQIVLFERELRSQRLKRALLAPVLAILVSLCFVGVAVGMWIGWPYLQSGLRWLLAQVAAL